MAEFFTSDLHLGHRLVASLRGFGTTREDADTDTHDNTIIRNWRRVIRDDNDIVWVLGDIVGQNRHYAHALEILATLPGRKRLIAGNHDVVASLHQRPHRHMREFLNVFETVQDFATITLPVLGQTTPGQTGVQPALLSHYPYLGTADDHTTHARYAQYRLPDHGTLLLHGHTHMPNQKVHLSDQGTPQVHVGLDAWNLTPITSATIAKAITATEQPTT